MSDANVDSFRSTLPQVGRALAAKLIAAAGGSVALAVAHFFTLPGDEEVEVDPLEDDDKDMKADDNKALSLDEDDGEVLDDDGENCSLEQLRELVGPDADHQGLWNRFGSVQAAAEAWFDEGKHHVSLHNCCHNLCKQLAELDCKCQSNQSIP